MREVAQQRINALEAEIAQLKEFVRTYNRLIHSPITDTWTADMWQRHAAANAIAERGRKQQLIDLAGTPTLTKKERILMTAHELLCVAEPRQTAALTEALAAKGVEVAPAELSVYLSKSDLFTMSRKDGGWYLAGSLRPASSLRQAGDRAIEKLRGAMGGPVAFQPEEDSDKS